MTQNKANEETKIACSNPDCDKVRPESHMWLPDETACERANGGKPVGRADLHKFALCGSCGHLLRVTSKEQGVTVYVRRLPEVLAILDGIEKAKRREQSRRERFKPFASKFLGPDGRPKVGMGLSRFKGKPAAEDAVAEEKSTTA